MMKIQNIKLLSICLLMYCSIASSQSIIMINAGNNLDVSTGADFCADTKSGIITGGGTWCDGVLPVQISYFNGAAFSNNIKLLWGTVWEINNSGFKVERSIALANLWQEIGFVTGSGTTNEQKAYFFDDQKLLTGKYKYRLKQIDYNGNYEYFALSGNVDVGVPKNFKMNQNYPNPSNPKSKIEYELPIDMRVIMKIYDISGKEVSAIMDAVQTAGYHFIEFDGTNLSSGV